MKPTLEQYQAKYKPLVDKTVNDMVGDQSEYTARTLARVFREAIERFLVDQYHFDNKKLATLTQEEDNEWVASFNFYIDQKCSQKEADKRAWADMQAQFPRLKDFDGCKP